MIQTNERKLAADVTACGDEQRRQQSHVQAVNGSDAGRAAQADLAEGAARGGTVSDDAVATSRTARACEGNIALCGDVLVVEDSIIIAMDIEDTLIKMGADSVHIAADVKEGFAFLARRRPAFAVLDFNLGAETSAAIARKLALMNIPFVFATGYDEETEIAREFPGVSVVQKPLAEDALKAAVNSLLSS
ncbi:response regulator [Pacificimonas sp. WHA3]|uniref:Response regulator n=1 Tax=Pacificimonas pallii TaxID=2827236 RepID=A0ABS6SE35_9SPHN|nr:response regulator [Pacificimonas pallii]MBV7256112.1 response regulator [Pacificimonas pallii]